MIKKIFFLIVYSTGLLATAQDNPFSSYNTSKTAINPAFAGSDSTLVLSAATQFNSTPDHTEDQYQHYFFSADNYFHFLRGGLALNYSFKTDLDGDKKTTIFSFSYASHFELFQHKLAVQPAIEFGYFKINQNIGYSFLEGDYMFAKRSGPDLSAGIVLFTKRFYGGFAMHYLNKPEYETLSDARLPVKYTLHAGGNFNIDNAIISPNILFLKQKNSTIFQIGWRAKYKILTLGMDISSYYLTVELGLQTRFFKLSYCPNFELGNETGYERRPVHEIHFNWFFKHKNKKQRSLRMI
jgi:type IX secretion system PorP/SprF family membrane protein